jgi:hypothetical protein
MDKIKAMVEKLMEEQTAFSRSMREFMETFIKDVASVNKSLAKIEARMGVLEDAKIRRTTPAPAEVAPIESIPAQPLAPEAIADASVIDSIPPACPTYAEESTPVTGPDLCPDRPHFVSTKRVRQSNVAPALQAPATLPLLNAHRLKHLIATGTLLLFSKFAADVFYPFDPGGSTW